MLPDFRCIDRSFENKIASRIIGSKRWLMDVFEKGSIKYNLIDKTTAQISISDSRQPWKNHILGQFSFKTTFDDFSVDETFLQNISPDGLEYLQNYMAPAVCHNIRRMINEEMEASSDIPREKKPKTFGPSLSTMYLRREKQKFLLNWKKFSGQSSLPEEHGLTVIYAPNDLLALQQFAKHVGLDTVTELDGDMQVFTISSLGTPTHYYVPLPIEILGNCIQVYESE